MHDLVAIKPDLPLPRRREDDTGIDTQEDRHVVIKAFLGGELESGHLASKR
jgi:hypothetical protein